MKIAILVDTLSVGGAERQAILCVSELRKLGHAADLIYYHPAVEYDAMLQQLGITPIQVVGASFRQRCTALRALFRRSRYDVVHGFKMAAEVYAALCGAWARVPHRFGSFRNVYNLGWKFRLLHFGIDKLLDGWIVNSEAAAQSMSHLTGIARRRIHLLRNGLSATAFNSSLSPDQARARLGCSAGSIIITIVARLEPPKNHPMFLAAAQKVLAQIPQARFLIVGKGSQEQRLRQCASALNIEAQVAFLGQRSDVADILAATDIAVLTSEHEGLPNALIEAMAAGKPVACTDYPGAREFLKHEHNALLSPCNQVGAFAENLLKLVSNPVLRERLGQNGRQFVHREFSPETMARRLEAIYLRHPDSHVQRLEPGWAEPLPGASPARPLLAGRLPSRAPSAEAPIATLPKQ
ncbi:MAG TPA: glycosyltransferase family 4 protein [Verrucomicrobiae bacterium]|nr:glycosyltransferase family 4 protein [Verrucomicrobiae bacterium]